MPEHVISLDPAYYLRDHLAVQGKTQGAVTPEALAEYLRANCCTGTIRAVREDYRAAAGIDLDMDRADDKAGHKIDVPLLALWGAQGTVGKLWDVPATWRAKSADSVTGHALPCDHLLPEEQPNLIISHFQHFFSTQMTTFVSSSADTTVVEELAAGVGAAAEAAFLRVDLIAPPLGLVDVDQLD